MIGIAGKTTNNNVFGTFPLDVSIRSSFRPLSHPSEHFLFGCLTGPMQSLTASQYGPLNNLRVGGPKEDSAPNLSIPAVDHAFLPLAQMVRALWPLGSHQNRTRSLCFLSLAINKVGYSSNQSLATASTTSGLIGCVVNAQSYWLEMVAVVPSNLVKVTVNGSLYVFARSLRKLSATASPSSREVSVSLRQWMPAWIP